MPAQEKAITQEPYEDVSPLSSDVDSDDDPVARHATNSTEITRKDNDILREEEERENLLIRNEGQDARARKGFMNRTFGNQESRGLQKKRTIRRQRRRHGSNDEDKELMYEMEEGGPYSPASSQASMSSSELDKMNLARNNRSSKVCLVYTQKA